ALRFGKGKITVVPISETGKRKPESKEERENILSAISNPKSEMPFSTGWHCAVCDLDIRPPTPGLLSFNNPLGACPECRAFGRTIAIYVNKVIPDRRLTITQGVVRFVLGPVFGESQKALFRACA